MRAALTRVLWSRWLLSSGESSGTIKRRKRRPRVGRDGTVAGSIWAVPKVAPPFHPFELGQEPTIFYRIFYRMVRHRALRGGMAQHGAAWRCGEGAGQRTCPA
jgi:hypothetical protein